MQDHSSLELRIDKITTFTPEELEFIISRIKETLTVKVPCPSIGSTQSYYDVASDLLDALFVGESIAEFCKDISFYESWDENRYRKTIHFVLTPQNPTELAKKLYWLSYLFEDEEEDEYEEKNDLISEVREAALDFQDHINLFEKKDYHFPLLVDDYFANFVIGLGEDSDDLPDEIEEINRDLPVQIQNYLYQNHSYIQSPYWQSLHYNFYTSVPDDAWLILSNTPIELSILEQMLDVYKTPVFKPLELQDASVIGAQDFEMIVFNNVEAIKYPFPQLTKAQECVADIYQIMNGVPIDSTATKVKQNLLSSYGDILIVADQIAQYIFFGDLIPKVPEETLKELAR